MTGLEEARDYLTKQHVSIYLAINDQKKSQEF